MSTGWQRIIAITRLARGGAGKDYAAKLHDCGAITDGPPFSGLCKPMRTCPVDGCDRRRSPLMTSCNSAAWPPPTLLRIIRSDNRADSSSPPRTAGQWG